MRILMLIAFAACPLLHAQQSAAAPLTTKAAKIEELFRLTKTDQMQKQVMAQMAAMMKQQTVSGMTPEARQAANDAMQRVMDFTMQKMSWEVMKPEFVKIYDATYTEDEISGILMFYQSPPGAAMLAKTPVLMANTMALLQKRMAEIKPELDEMIRKSVAK
jgi:uncharacterized protein